MRYVHPLPPPATQAAARLPHVASVEEAPIVIQAGPGVNQKQNGGYHASGLGHHLKNIMQSLAHLGGLPILVIVFLAD